MQFKGTCAIVIFIAFRELFGSRRVQGEHLRSAHFFQWGRVLRAKARRENGAEILKLPGDISGDVAAPGSCFYIFFSSPRATGNSLKMKNNAATAGKRADGSQKKKAKRQRRGLMTPRRSLVDMSWRRIIQEKNSRSKGTAPVLIDCATGTFAPPKALDSWAAFAR